MKKIIIVLIISYFLCSCVVVINLEYMPDFSKKRPLAPLENIKFSINVKDNRSKDNKEYILKAGAGMVGKANPEVTIAIYEAIKKELVESGNLVVSVDNDSSQLRVSITVHEFWSDVHNMEFCTKIYATVNFINVKDNSIFYTNFVNTHLKRPFLNIDYYYQRAFNDTLHKFVEDIFYDFELINALKELNKS